MAGAHQTVRGATITRQLPLPLPSPGPAPPSLPLTFVLLPAGRVWGELTLAQQTHVRRTALCILREVLDDTRR